MREDKPSWISQQVPDGTDWLEYMIVGTPDGRGIPPTMSAADLGVLDHFSLGVVNAEAAYTLLWNGDRLAVPVFSLQGIPGRCTDASLRAKDDGGTRRAGRARA